jgi:hypothetical protein
VNVPQDKGPLKGKPRKENNRKRKASTPAAVASEQASGTPERAELDFTFKNAWLARVARGFTKEEVVDLALSTRRPYERAKDSGVPLPDIPGGYDSVTMENFDDVVQTLENLAEFGNWDHSSEPPDLPAEYADAPSFSNAVATLAYGIELTEIMHNKALPKKMQQKRICSNGIFKKLGVKAARYDELSQNVLKGLLQNNRFWASDSGSITPYRFEFYLRSRGVTSEMVEMVLSFGKDSPGAISRTWTRSWYASPRWRSPGHVRQRRRKQKRPRQRLGRLKRHRMLWSRRANGYS